MKQLFSKLILCIILIGCTSGENQKSDFVFDFEQILSPDQEVDLNKLLRAHEQKTTNEIAVVTTPDWGEQENIVFYAVEFGEKQGVGKKDKDNGVVIVFSQNMRETRISTGYGTENVLKDEIAKEIIDSLMIPEFKKGKYFEGIYVGTKAVIDFLEKPGNEIKEKTGANKK